MDPVILPNKTLTYYPVNSKNYEPNPKPVLPGSCMTNPSQPVSPLHDIQPNHNSYISARKQVRFADIDCIEFIDDEFDIIEINKVLVPMTPSKCFKNPFNKINYKLAGGAVPKNKYSKNQHLKQTNLNFKHPITNNDLCIAKVPGDGSCQFHALTYKTELSSINLRKQVAAHIKQNPATFKEYIYNDSIENYTKRMLLSSTWGDQNTLAAAADVLNSYIHVFSKATNTQLFSPSQPNSDTLTTCVFYNGTTHYDASIDSPGKLSPEITLSENPAKINSCPHSNPDNKIKMSVNESHNLRIATLNICSLALHIEYLCSLPFDILLLQEVLVRSEDRRSIEITLKKHGWNITWGADLADRPTKIKNKSLFCCAQNQTLAIMAKDPTGLIRTDDRFTPEFLQIYNRGHGMHAVVPIQDGKTFLHVINFYGQTGARGSQGLKQKMMAGLRLFSTSLPLLDMTLPLSLEVTLTMISFITL